MNKEQVLASLMAEKVYMRFSSEQIKNLSPQNRFIFHLSNRLDLLLQMLEQLKERQTVYMDIPVGLVRHNGLNLEDFWWILSRLLEVRQFRVLWARRKIKPSGFSFSLYVPQGFELYAFTRYA